MPTDSAQAYPGDVETNPQEVFNTFQTAAVKLLKNEEVVNGTFGVDKQRNQSRRKFEQM